MATLEVEVVPSEEHPGFFAVQLRLDGGEPQELAPLEEPVANVRPAAAAAGCGLGRLTCQGVARRPGSPRRRARRLPA